MTRINVIPPAELCRQHLVAEYRELPRVFALARKAQTRTNQPVAPAEYTLGNGHVRFFYDKAQWLVRRHAALVAEMERRGYAPAFRCCAALADGLQSREWIPDERALELNRARIKERLPA